MMHDARLLLRDLQGALSASQLYPREHPRLVQLTNRIVHAAASIPAGRSLEVFSIDGLLVVNGEQWRDGDQVGTGLFGLMAACGVHRLTIDQTLGVDSVHRFLEWLLRLRGGSQDQVGPPVGLPGLRLSAIAEPGEAVGDIAALYAPLLQTWGGLLDEGHYDANAIDYVVMALARTVERHAGALIPLATLRAHDDYTVMHITNVAMLALALAEAAGLPHTAVVDVGVAALLHDIGKLRVPSEVLNAPGRLTTEQAAVMKRHPDEGARLLLAVPNVPELAVVVAYEHHVHYDGGGYPVVPPGWKINLASAITTVADVYDALRSDRPYRRGLDPDEVRDLMRKESGTMFAPALLDAFFDQVVPRTVLAGAA